MKIAILGYGKMGKAIKKSAESYGHAIASIVDRTDDLSKLLATPIDVVIEFSQPDAAYENIKFCLDNQLPIISGTTGWLDKYDELASLCEKKGGTFLYASNFSISVNLFFELNEWVAKKMNQLDYSIDMEEIHHTEKKDAPSGTAITLAEGIIKNINRVNGWANEKITDQTKIPIVSKRESNFPGTHNVTYSTPLESISIEHVAKDRRIFADGAVAVAYWIHNKKGVLSMSDFIKQL